MEKNFFTLGLLLCINFFTQANNPLPEDPNVAKIERALRNIRAHNVQFVDFTWCDISGHEKQVTYPVSKIENLFEGFFFDGSSVGMSSIDDSDLLALPDPETCSFSPWKSDGFASARFYCDVFDSDGTPHKNDPRSALRKVLKQLDDHGYSTLAGAEMEFFLFKKDADSLIPIDTRGYCDTDTDLTIKTFKEMLLYGLIHLGVDPEKIHHEVALGQFEVVLGCTNALTLADRIQLTKQTIKMFAEQNGYQATFMAKPLAGVNGTGMHVHSSLKKNGVNAFFDKNKQSYLSDTARSFISGILKHVRGLNVLFNSEVNSSKRLVAGFEAPTFICCGNKNRSAAIRIPEVPVKNVTTGTGSAVRIELRWPDADCNPYLMLAALFGAGLDGILKNEKATDFVDQNLYHITAEEQEALEIQILPSSLKEALDLFETNDFAKQLLGESLHRNFLEEKRKEWNEFIAQEGEFDPFFITEWEIARGISCYSVS